MRRERERELGRELEREREREREKESDKVRVKLKRYIKERNYFFWRKGLLHGNARAMFCL